MSAGVWLAVIAHVVGGLGLFLFGMHVMTAGLRAAAGSGLRVLLARATRNPLAGITLGTALGFLAHSGAATTMIASFTNAGLMSLEGGLAPMLGANVGTTLSMQMISFDLGKYAWWAVGIGVLLRLGAPWPRVKESGGAILGFGLLFLGMTHISEALAPHREALIPWLQHVHGETWSGRLIGVGLSALFTALITSSGAMLGLCFALAGAGVFTQFDEIFPLVLGAHIGTCIVALTAGLPMNIEARRSALGHLVFNVFNVALALAVYPLMKAFILWSSPDLTRQIANLHTTAMGLGALVCLPASRPIAWFLRRLLPSRQPLPEPSYLDEALLPSPEQALRAVLLELRRMARLCSEGMLLNGEIILTPSSRLVSRLQANEDVLDEVKDAVGGYLSRLTDRHLSRRQTMFLQHLDRCMKDIERIGDHLTAIAETSMERMKHRDGLLPHTLFEQWFELFCAARQVVTLMEKSLDPEIENFQQTALEILKARDCYMIQSMDLKAEFAGSVEQKAVTPLAGYYLGRYIADLDRLVRHAKSIAFAERQPDFLIKRKKLSRVAPPAAHPVPPTPVAPEDYLARLKQEQLLGHDEELDGPGKPSNGAGGRPGPS